MPSKIIPTSSSPLNPSTANTVNATVTFATPRPSIPSDEKWYININNIEDRNYDNVPTPITIHDIRGQESKSHVDVTGFQAITSPSDVSEDLLLGGTDEEIRKVYYPEVEALLKKATGASRVVFFDHTVRKPRPGEEDTPSTRQPVMRAHVDQTPLSAHKRVTRHVQPPQPYKRFQIINVWRPIQNTVYDYPLAVCEAPSADIVNDLVPTTLVYPAPTPNGETYNVRYNKNQVWWYWSEMTPSDVLLLKCYDSASQVLTTVKSSAAEVDENELRDVAGLTPHTAFFHAEGAKVGIRRQSIEVRALVFYD